MFFAIILLSEYDIMNDKLADELVDKVKNHHKNNGIDMVSTIKSVIFSDYRFKANTKGKKFEERNNDKFNILQKIALNLNVSEEKVVFIILMDIQHEHLNMSQNSTFSMKNFFWESILFNLF